MAAMQMMEAIFTGILFDGQRMVDGFGPKSPFLTIASSARKMTVNQNYIIFLI